MKLGTPELIQQARNNNGISVIVSGYFLIDNGLAEEWAETRGIATKAAEFPAYYQKGFVDGKITEEFRDYISIGQAKCIGLVD